MLQLYQAQQIIDVFLLGLHGKVTLLQQEHSIPCVCECFGVCVSYTVFHTPSRTYKVPCMCALLSTPQLSLHKKVILIR